MKDDFLKNMKFEFIQFNYVGTLAMSYIQICPLFGSWLSKIKFGTVINYKFEQTAEDMFSPTNLSSLLFFVE